MILDRIDNVRFYQNLSPLIKQGLDYIKNLKISDLKNQKLNHGNGITGQVSVYIGRDPSLLKFESHRTHVDIEYIVKGQEYVEFEHPDNLKVKEAYDPQKDVKYYHDPISPTRLLIKESYFIIYYPDDAHKSGIKANDNEVYKVWLRIPLK
jgi:YhcH/YjgK/YiaL family protein